jgi:hypothetical protein
VRSLEIISRVHLDYTIGCQGVRRTRKVCSPPQRSQGVNPLRGLALAHPTPSPVYDLKGVRVQVDEDTQQPIVRCRQRTVLISRVPAGGARLAVETPGGYMRLEGGLNRWNPRLPRLHGETGQIQRLCTANLEIGESSRAHGGGLLLLEA